MNEKEINYIDYQGNPLPNHDGTMLYISEKDGYQFFGIDGQGFIHDSTPVILPDGRKQFFLSNGKAIIHDGTPIQLANGSMQYFDHEGSAIWPMDEKRLTPLINQQREEFFKIKIQEINQITPLSEGETEDLRLALLAAEHTDSEECKNLTWLKSSPSRIQPIHPEMAGMLIIFENLWRQVWRKYQLRHKEMLAARYNLTLIKNQQNCQIASLSVAEILLANELKFEFKKAEKTITIPVNESELEQLGMNSNGVYILDELLLKFINKMKKGEGTESFKAQFNEAYRTNNIDVKSRIKLWKHPLFMHRCIANVIWFNSVKEKTQGVYRKSPALTYVVNEQVHRPMCNGAKFNVEDGKIIDQRGQELALIDMSESRKILPSMNIDIIQKILRPENIKVLSTVNAHRLLRWEIQTVTKQFVEGMIDARALKVYGGYQELARHLGIGNNRRATEQLRDIIVWQAAPRFYQPNGRYGNMLSFDYTPSGHGRQAVLQLVLGNMMLPHYVYELLNMPEVCVSDRRLIPIVDMPPLIGRSNDQGAQPSYQMEILVEMRKGAREFATNGCVLIPKNRLGELAEKAGLSKRLFLKVIDRWLQDGTDAPAFLKMIETDRYALGNNFKQAEDFIIEAGKKEMAMSKAGKKSIAKRNAGIFKT